MIARMLLASLGLAFALASHAQAPIRIGAFLSVTGTSASRARASPR